MKRSSRVQLAVVFSLGLRLALASPAGARELEYESGLGGGESSPPSSSPQDSGASGGDSESRRAEIESALTELEARYELASLTMPGPGATVASDLALVEGELRAAAELSAAEGVPRDSEQSLAELASVRAELDSSEEQGELAKAEVAAMAPASRAPTGGDPVLLATGALLHREVDLDYAFHDTAVRVERTYRSDRSSWSSFGRGWSFPYDTRIIRGGSLDAESLCRSAAEAQRLIDALVAEDAERLGAATEELTSRRDLLALRRARAAGLEGEASGLLDESVLWADLAAAARALGERIRATREAYDLMDRRLAEALSAIAALDSPGGALSALRERGEECGRLAAEAARLVSLERAAARLDRYTLHAEDPGPYRGAGCDAVILVDESGEPHLYRFATPPAFGAGPGGPPVTELADGAPSFFPQGARLEPERPRDDRLALRADGVYELTRKGGSICRYGASGLLQEIEDRNHNLIRFRYDEAMRLVELVDDYGRRLTIERQGERIASITDPIGRSVRYGYDASGRLAEVIDPAGDRIAYRYDGARLVAIEKPDASTIRYSYGPVGAGMRVLSTTDEEGASERFEYLEGETIHTNPSGIVTRYSYDDRMRETRITHADGTFIEKRYNDLDDLIALVDETGSETSYEYDADGNVTAVVHPDGSRSRASYNRFGRPERRIDEEGNEVSYRYDDRGNLLRIDHPDASSLSFAYEERGDLTCVVDQRGNASRIDRDRYGYPSSYVDPLGAAWSFAHDAVGNLTSRSDPDGVATGFRYAKDGRLTEIVDSEGGRIRYRYDRRKDLAEEIDQTGATTRRLFDRRHLPIRIVDAAGGVREYRYRADRRLERASSGSGSRIDYTYDARGDCSRVTQVETGISIAFARDAAGRVSAVTDGRGNITRYLRDDRGRIVAVEAADGSLSRAEYAQNGYLIALVDELGNRSERTVDSAGRVIALRNPLGDEESFAYDEAGNLVRFTDRNGAVTSYSYDEANRLVRTDDPTGASTRYLYTPAGRLRERIDRRGAVTRYDYDGEGRLATRSGPLGERWEYSYDARGRLVAATDPNGGCRQWSYDALGRVLAESDPAGYTTSRAYGPSGAIGSLTDPCGAIWRYEVDPAGRLATVIDPLGGVARFVYDPNGNLVESIDQLGERTTAGYDAKGRLASLTDGAGARVEYRYDSSGRLVAEVDGLGRAYGYEYDRAGRLAAEVNRSGARKSYGYDKAGDIISVTDFAGRTTRYERDAAGRVVCAELPDGSRREYRYDGEGNLVRAANKAADLRFEYDASTRLVRVRDAIGGDELRYDYDPAGNPSVVRRSDSTPIAELGYGKRGEVVSVSLPGHGSIGLDYDRAGRETMRAYPNGITVRRWYDPAGRVIGIRASHGSLDDGAWAEIYLYDAAGRRTSTIRRDGTFLGYRYDGGGRLAEVAYPYDDGVREADLLEMRRAGLAGALDSPSPSLEARSAMPDGHAGAAVMPSYLSMPPDAAEALRELAGAILPPSRGPARLVEKVWKESFSYDGAGNRIEKRTSFGAIPYSYGADHELQRAGRCSYEYDPNGNMIGESSPSGSVEYRYGPDNRLSEVLVAGPLTRAGGRTAEIASISYDYDALGRRVGRVESAAAGRVLSKQRFFCDRFSFDPIRIRLEGSDEPPKSVSGTLPAAAGGPFLSEGPLRRAPATGGPRYRYPAGGEQPVAPQPAVPQPVAPPRGRIEAESITRIYAAGSLMAAVGDEGAEYYAHDLLGSVASITDGRGRIVAEYLYDVFGLCSKGMFDARRTTGYTGRDMDPETGIYTFGFRDYVPAIARFTSPDPVGAGGNWYVYAANDPVNRVDPLGLDSFFASFNKDTNTMTGIYVSTTGTTINPDKTFSYQWTATNHVRNELNGERDAPDVGTIPVDGSSSQAYFPRQVPNGVHNLSPSVNRGGAAFVPTDATCLVPTYGPYNPKTPPQPDPWTGSYIPTGVQLDVGYNIEPGGPYSLGCVQMPAITDYEQFRSLSDRALASSGSSSLEVSGGKRD